LPPQRAAVWASKRRV